MVDTNLSNVDIIFLVAHLVFVYVSYLVCNIFSKKEKHDPVWNTIEKHIWYMRPYNLLIFIVFLNIISPILGILAAYYFIKVHQGKNKLPIYYGLGISIFFTLSTLFVFLYIPVHGSVVERQKRYLDVWINLLGKLF